MASKFGSPNADAFVMVPQGVKGPRFLVTRNFLAIMDYNLSHSYALAVGHLADRIRGMGEFVAAGPMSPIDLTYKQRVELQNRLNALGFETGGNDGRFGARTYEAIIAYQKKNGLAARRRAVGEAAAGDREERLMKLCAAIVAALLLWVASRGAAQTGDAPVMGSSATGDAADQPAAPRTPHRRDPVDRRCHWRRPRRRPVARRRAERRL